MVNKKELLDDLSGYLKFEEEIVGKLTIFYQALDWRSAVKPEQVAIIEKGLMALKADTEKHSRMIKEMLEYAVKAEVDEF